jgi:hypothetical protein
MKINFTLALSLIGLTFATPSTLAEHGQNHKAGDHEAHTKRMLEGYAAVSKSLYMDNLIVAKAIAAGMVAYDKNSAMAKPAKAIAASKDIKTARMHFKMLSDAAILIAKKQKTMHWMHCPMAMGGKGADWLQKSADPVQNPYFGKKMPHCGWVVK